LTEKINALTGQQQSKRLGISSFPHHHHLRARKIKKKGVLLFFIVVIVIWFARRWQSNSWQFNGIGTHN
jgi:hypothetical protein